MKAPVNESNQSSESIESSELRESNLLRPAGSLTSHEGIRAATLGRMPRRSFRFESEAALFSREDFSPPQNGRAVKASRRGRALGFEAGLGKSGYAHRANCDTFAKAADTRRTAGPLPGERGASAMEEEQCQEQIQPRAQRTAAATDQRELQSAPSSAAGFPVGISEEPDNFQPSFQPSCDGAPPAGQGKVTPAGPREGFPTKGFPQAPIESGAGHVDSAGSVELDDFELVTATQAGDASAFDVLVLRHTSKLYGLVYHMSGSHEDTDDLLQEIWAKVFRVLPSFRGASRFSTWIHSIAVNMTLNFLKKRSRRTAVSLDANAAGSNTAFAELQGLDPELESTLVCTQTPRSDANLAELQRLLSAAMEQLTPEHRAVVTMFDIQGMAHAEIAKVMGISEGTVRSRLFYAHRQLQGFLSELSTDFFQTPKKSAL